MHNTVDTVEVDANCDQRECEQITKKKKNDKNELRAVIFVCRFETREFQMNDGLWIPIASYTLKPNGTVSIRMNDHNTRCV